MRGEKDRHEDSEESSVKHKTSPVRAYLTLSNVTQAAVHKGEMERTNNTHKKKLSQSTLKGSSLRLFYAYRLIPYRSPQRQTG